MRPRHQLPRKRQISLLPTASGGIARAAYAKVAQRPDLESLLRRSGLTMRQINNSKARLLVKNQITFLNLAAEASQDGFFGMRLAQNIDLRELGLLYYVLASSDTLGDALPRIARYSSILNEGVLISYREREDLSITFEYRGVARLSDRHQMEFFVTTLLRTCRQLTGRRLSPSRISFKHARTALPAGFKALFGCEVAFGSGIDEVVYPHPVKFMPVVNADPYLNLLLLDYCEQSLSRRRTRPGEWRVAVENDIAPHLPHGQVDMSEVAHRLGASRRTLARRLASEGITFVDVLKDMRLDLAMQYLREPVLPISEIAWLLGYREVSAFSHAFKRWTGKTPRQVRASAGQQDR
jgi:AraC-like DNA-binding protein